MSSDAVDAPAVDVDPVDTAPTDTAPTDTAPTVAPARTAARARLDRISADATAHSAVRVLRLGLTLSWLARIVGVAALAYGVILAQSKVGDPGPWEPAIRGAIALIAVIVVSIWLLAETWAAHERRASRHRTSRKRR